MHFMEYLILRIYTKDNKTYTYILALSSLDHTERNFILLLLCIYDRVMLTQLSCNLNSFQYENHSILTKQNLICQKIKRKEIIIKCMKSLCFE